jgi:hypothetical protein
MVAEPARAGGNPVEGNLVYNFLFLPFTLAHYLTLLPDFDSPS